MMWAWCAAAHAGVWVHDAGSGYAELAIRHQWSDRILLADATAVPQTDPAVLGDLSSLLEDGKYSATDLSAYAELGLGNGFEGLVSLPLRYAQNRWSLARGSYPDIVSRNAGPGDLTAGARYGKQHGPLAWSAYLTATLPLYSNHPRALRIEAGNSDFEDDRVPLGQGTLNAETGAGVGAGGRLGWGLAEAGVRVRSQQFSAVLPLRIQAGIRPVDRVSVWASASAQVSLGNGAAPDFFRDEWGKGPIALDNQSVVMADLGAHVGLVSGVGLVASVSRVLWGQRFPLLTAGSIGVTWNMTGLWPRLDR